MEIVEQDEMFTNETNMKQNMRNDRLSMALTFQVK